MIPGLPAFAEEQFRVFFGLTERSGYGPPPFYDSPRPVVAGAPHPRAQAARPLNARPSSDDIARNAGASR
jgi:hypothetical protein